MEATPSQGVQRRTAWLAERQIQFSDVGVSVSVWGAGKRLLPVFGASEAAAIRLKPYMGNSHPLRTAAGCIADRSARAFRQDGS
jgi:6-phosphogluconate dehydrogenase (decarboxylating)